MKYLAIILVAILAILIVVFISWFLNMKANGKCPLCALKKIFIPTKLTIDISEDEEYSENKVAQTPPMGWSSWNTFRNNIDQDIIMQTAHAMKDSGLANAGYEFINLDDCWQSSLRDSDEKLQGDLGTFSRGIPKLIKDINALGLKVGLYSSNGTLTCEDLPASLGNERLDAKTIASWGCEFFKYDFCHHDRISGDCPAIEHIVITKPKSAFEIDLRPEDAEFTGRAKIIKMSDVPSKKAIGFISHGSGSASFNFDAEEKGEYVLTFVFHKSMAKKKQYMQIHINGKMYEIFFPETKGFSPLGRQQIIVELKEGTNNMTIKNPVATAIDSSYIQYKRMGDALKEASSMWAKVTHSEEKPITYSICEWGMARPYLWGAKAGSMWRTTPDIAPNWRSITMIYNRTLKLYKHSGPGHWNDPDMLEVGNGKLDDNENRAHFSLWCMLAAPLMLGNDIRSFVSNGMPDKDNETLKIVTNKHMIAVDQDSLGKSAKRIKKESGIDIIARPLSNGDVALCLFNTASSTKSVNFKLDDLTKDPYLGIEESPSGYELHDLWTDERSTGTTINATIPKHSTVVYRVKPTI